MSTVTCDFGRPKVRITGEALRMHTPSKLEIQQNPELAGKLVPRMVKVSKTFKSSTPHQEMLVHFRDQTPIIKLEFI